MIKPPKIQNFLIQVFGMETLLLMLQFSVDPSHGSMERKGCQAVDSDD